MTRRLQVLLENDEFAVQGAYPAGAQLRMLTEIDSAYLRDHSDNAPNFGGWPEASHLNP